MKEEGKKLGCIIKPRREKVIPMKYSDLPYIGLEHVEAHTTKLLGNASSSEMKSSANRFYEGDVLYSRLRPYLNKVWHADRDGLCSSEFIVLPSNASVDGRFLCYRLNSADFVSFANSLNAGDRPRVDFDQISSFLLPPFSLSQQRRIVAEIEKQFSRLEEGVNALKRVQANLKRYRAAVLKAACEGKLVENEVKLALSRGQKSASSANATEDREVRSQKGYESGEQLLKRILDERHKNWSGRGKYKEPVTPDTTNLPQLPDGWTWATLESIAEALGGFAFKSDHYSESGYQIVKMGNLKMGQLDLTQRPSFISNVSSDIVEKYSLKHGDILITLTGTRNERDYGYVVEVKEQQNLLLNQRIARLRPVEHIVPSYLQIAMQSESYRNRFFAYETGNVGQGNVGMRAVTIEPIALPPLAEQKRIVDEVERRLSVVEELEFMVTANLQRASRLRQAVLQKAFEGELVV